MITIPQPNIATIAGWLVARNSCKYTKVNDHAKDRRRKTGKCRKHHRGDCTSTRFARIVWWVWVFSVQLVDQVNLGCCNQASKKADPWAFENSGRPLHRGTPQHSITPHQIQQMLLHVATFQYMSCKCHQIPECVAALLSVSLCHLTS